MKEAKEFIIKKMNECFLCIHENYPGSIFHIWDKQALRTKKLLRLLGKEIEFKPGQNSLYFFEQDYKTGYFRYSYCNIYEIINNEYGYNYKQINKIITDILKKDKKMNILTPINDRWYVQSGLEINDKWKQLKPSCEEFQIDNLL